LDPLPRVPRERSRAPDSHEAFFDDGDNAPSLIRRCVRCGNPNPREKAKYCRPCGAEATRAWRAIRRTLPGGAAKPPTPPKRSPTPAEIELVRARAYVSTYVRRGKLQKKPCQNCGNPQLKKIGPFHPDPAKRLSFIWMCLPCAKLARSGLKTAATQTRRREAKRMEANGARDRARAAMLLIRALPAPSRLTFVTALDKAFIDFRLPPRPHGVLYQELARNMYEATFGIIGVERARDTLARHHIEPFSISIADGEAEQFFTEATRREFWIFEEASNAAAPDTSGAASTSRRSRPTSENTSARKRRDPRREKRALNSSAG
jgi:ribosomal protein L37E